MGIIQEAEYKFILFDSASTMNYMETCCGGTICWMTLACFAFLTGVSSRPVAGTRLYNRDSRDIQVSRSIGDTHTGVLELNDHLRSVGSLQTIHTGQPSEGYCRYQNLRKLSNEKSVATL